jgi:hypothetical protein
MAADMEQLLRQTVVEKRAKTNSVAAAPEEDVVEWVREAGVKIESKGHGRIPFAPFPYQEDVMRLVQRGDDLIVDKCRQTGITTCTMIALAHELLYRHELRGIPLHAHVIAYNEDVAVNAILKIAKLALVSAKLTSEQRRHLRGTDPKVGTSAIYYTTGAAENYIMAHAASDNAGRSYSPNCVYMDEVVFIEAPEAIYGGFMGGLDLDEGQMMLSSTYRDSASGRPTPGFQFFCDMVDNAEEMGFIHYPIDWTLKPGQDQAWWDRILKKYKGMEHIARQEYALERFSSSSTKLNPQLLTEAAKRHPWLGDEARVNHRYSKGIDVSGSGRDKTVFYAVDISASPAQLIHCERHHGLGSQQKIDYIKAFCRKWPGPCFIDGTNDHTLPGLLVTGPNPVQELRIIHFCKGVNVGEVHPDPTSGIPAQSLPVAYMESLLVSNLELGDLVVHLDNFPELKKALLGWRQPPTRTDGRQLSRKDLLPNADDRDGLMLADLALDRARGKAYDISAQLIGDSDEQVLESRRRRL